MTPGWIRATFVLSGLYDLAVGGAFLFAGDALFAAAKIEPPNHPGWVQFPALLVVLFGLMFLQIGSDPRRFRALMPYGIGLKASYAGVVLYHHATTGLPALWVPFAWADLVFLLVFLAAWRATAPDRSAG